MMVDTVTELALINVLLTGDMSTFPARKHSCYVYKQCAIILNKYKKIYSIYLPKNVIHFFRAEPPIIIGQVMSLNQQRLLFPYITVQCKKEVIFSTLYVLQEYRCSSLPKPPAAEFTGHIHNRDLAIVSCTDTLR